MTTILPVIFSAVLDFSKPIFSAKKRQIFLKLVENMCLQPQTFFSQNVMVAFKQQHFHLHLLELFER